MRRQAKALLLFGCAVVLVLELPSALACLAASWKGPYAAESCPSCATAGPRQPQAVPAGRLDLARR